MTYHLGFSRGSISVASHVSCDLEILVKHSCVDVCREQSLLSLCLLALTRPDYNDWHLLIHWHMQ